MQPQFVDTCEWALLCWRIICLPRWTCSTLCWISAKLSHSDQSYRFIKNYVWIMPSQSQKVGIITFPTKAMTLIFFYFFFVVGGGGVGGGGLVWEIHLTSPLFRCFISGVRMHGANLAHPFLYSSISWIVWWIHSVKILSIMVISFYLAGQLSLMLCFHCCDHLSTASMVMQVYRCWIVIFYSSCQPPDSSDFHTDIIIFHSHSSINID